MCRTSCAPLNRCPRPQVTAFVSMHEVGLIDAEGGVMRDPVGGPTLNLASGGAGVAGQTFASWGEETSSALTFGLFCACWELANRPEDEGGLGRPIRRGVSCKPDVMMGLNMSKLAHSIASAGSHVSGRPERLEQLAALNPPFVWSMPDAKAEEFEELIVALREASRRLCWRGRWRQPPAAPGRSARGGGGPPGG